MTYSELKFYLKPLINSYGFNLVK